MSCSRPLITGGQVTDEYFIHAPYHLHHGNINVESVMEKVLCAMDPKKLRCFFKALNRQRKQDSRFSQLDYLRLREVWKERLSQILKKAHFKVDHECDGLDRLEIVAENFRQEADEDWLLIEA
jgi:hypothetical protein